MFITSRVLTTALLLTGLAAPPPRFYQRVVGTLRRRIRIDEWSDQVQPRLVRGVLHSEREWCPTRICLYPGRGYAKSGRKLEQIGSMAHVSSWPSAPMGLSATPGRKVRTRHSHEGHVG
jgi:hypothetical protein